LDERSRPREKNGQAERTVPCKAPGIRRKTQDELYDKGAGIAGGEPFPDCSTQSPEIRFRKRERIIQCQMKPISQTREKKSGWYMVILKIPLTPDLSEEAEKIGAQERTEGKVRMRMTKALSDEAASKDVRVRTGDTHPEISNQTSVIRYQ
jgi:hypothetical protein